MVCRGHGNNVTDLAWSNDDALLATASLDGSVGVWEARSGRRLATLRHNNFCKGVAWDPLGSYLASQGDDGIRIWRCEGWEQVAHIKYLFERSSTHNFSLRCAFVCVCVRGVHGGGGQGRLAVFSGLVPFGCCPHGGKWLLSAPGRL